jgi:fructosamine-3-kinase
MLSKEIRSEVEEVISVHAGEPCTIKDARPLGGGCINNAFAISTDAGNFFLKTNDAAKYPGMFEAEANGLKLLASANAIVVPSVIDHGIAGKDSFLLLELAEQGKLQNDSWEDFGASLAKLHTNTQQQFGLDHNNYIGSLHQSNRLHDTWSSFFSNERLEPQLRLALDTGRAGSGLRAKFEKLFLVMDEIFPVGKPSLLHGDLWSGNFMISPGGKACIYDPAVYFGNREMDIATTKLFGGFEEGFYEGYNDAFPLEKGWQQRVDICNLYPLMVHVNLFGGGYLNDVERILNKF